MSNEEKQKQLQSGRSTNEIANGEIKLKTYQSSDKIQLSLDTVGVRVKNTPIINRSISFIYKKYR